MPSRNPLGDEGPGSNYNKGNGGSQGSLFSPGKATDPAFIHNRESPQKAQFREWIDALYQEARSFIGDSETHFQTDIRHHFNSRIWEIYLIALLKRKGFRLIPTRPKGPDICLEMDEGKHLWIEATASDLGSGPDKMIDPPLQEEEIRFEPGPNDEGIILRLLNSLQVKRAALDSFLGERTDPAIIAISGASLPLVDISWRLPFMGKALFGLGRDYYSVDRQTFEAEMKSKFRVTIGKASGAQVPSNPFCNADSGYACVSGVLFSHIPLIQVKSHEETSWGRELSFFHNPFARNPLPLGIFHFTKEYYVDVERSLLIFNGPKGISLPNDPT